MVRPCILPDVGVLAKLRAKHRRDPDHPDGCSQGHTLAQIAEMYGVTVSGVYKHLRNRNMTDERPRYTETLPWTVAAEHAQDWSAHMLRELAKRDAGLPPGQRGVYLDDWLAGLDRGHRHVIDYSPETGFVHVRRRKSDGESYIRRPVERRTRKATS